MTMREPQIGIEPMTAPSNALGKTGILARCCNLARAIGHRVRPKRTQKRLQSCNEVATATKVPFARAPLAVLSRYSTPRDDIAVHLQFAAWGFFA